MATEEQSGWKVTDPDCLQCCREATEIASNLYELVQVNSFGPEISGQEFFQVVHDYICLDDYSKEEELQTLAMYGYDPLDRHDDLQNSSDEEFNQYLAEMYFETESFELSFHECTTWNQAVDHIQKLTGMDLSMYKEAEKEQPSQAPKTSGDKPRLNAMISDAQSKTSSTGGKNPISPDLGR